MNEFCVHLYVFCVHISKMKEFELFTDGACYPNPGFGGWAFILRYKGDKLSLITKKGNSNGILTTNNRMEMQAVIEGLKCVLELHPQQPSVLLCSDSQYVLKSLSIWLDNWVKKEWKKSDGSPVINVDLLTELYNLKEKVNLQYIHIDGHTGHEENEMCDKLAYSEIKRNGELFE